VKYFNNTSYGEAGIHWEKTDNNFLMEVTVPVGCRATVYVPVKTNQQITDNGKSISESTFVKQIGEENSFNNGECN